LICKSRAADEVVNIFNKAEEDWIGTGIFFEKWWLELLQTARNRV